MKTGSAVNLYVRHRRACSSAERHNNSRCRCPWWIQYQVDTTKADVPPGADYKESARTSDWNQARALADAIERGQPDPLPAPVEGSTQPKTDGLTIQRALQLFCISKRDAGKSDEIIGRYRLHIGNLQEDMRRHGVVLLSEVTVEHLLVWGADYFKKYRRHKDEHGVARFASSSLKKNRGYVKAFFRYCEDNGWLMDRHGRAVAWSRAFPGQGEERVTRELEQKEPYSPAEMLAILTALEPRSRLAVHPWDWSEDEILRMRTLVLLMRWSGLAIQDAGTLKRSQLDNKNFVSRKRTKTSKAVSVLLPPDVAELLRAVPNADPEYFFWNAKTIQKRSFVALLHKRFLQIWRAAGFKKKGEEGYIHDKRPTPHRFRHTFAVESRLAGVSWSAIARSMGDNESTVIRYYNGFIKEREDAIAEEHRASWARQQARLKPSTPAVQHLV